MVMDIPQTTMWHRRRYSTFCVFRHRVLWSAGALGIKFYREAAPTPGRLDIAPSDDAPQMMCGPSIPAWVFRESSATSASIR